MGPYFGHMELGLFYLFSKTLLDIYTEALSREGIYESGSWD